MLFDTAISPCGKFLLFADAILRASIPASRGADGTPVLPVSSWNALKFVSLWFFNIANRTLGITSIV